MFVVCGLLSAACYPLSAGVWCLLFVLLLVLLGCFLVCLFVCVLLMRAIVVL